eukprot:736633-Prymnesium_polylepis.1
MRGEAPCGDVRPAGQGVRGAWELHVRRMPTEGQPLAGGRGVVAWRCAGACVAGPYFGGGAYDGAR